MSDGYSLEDVLFEFYFHHYPVLLEDDELFDKVLLLTHNLMRDAARRERKAALTRVLTPSKS